MIPLSRHLSLDILDQLQRLVVWLSRAWGWRYESSQPALSRKRRRGLRMLLLEELQARYDIICWEHITEEPLGARGDNCGSGMLV